MEKNVDEAARVRNAARGALVAEKEARREAMLAARELNPGGKLARRLAPVIIEQDVFDDWRREKGGLVDTEVEFLRWLCAQVASGVTARVLCGYYGVVEGLLGAWLTEVPDRLAQYRRAQNWAAEGLVDEALEEAWDDGPDVVRSKLRVTTNMQVAGKYNRAMYGEEKQQGVGGAPVINFVMGEGSVGSVVIGGGVPPEKDVTPERPAVLQQEVETVDAVSAEDLPQI